MNFTITVNLVLDLSPAATGTLTTLVASLVGAIDNVAEAIIDQQETISAMTALKAKLDSIDPVKGNP